MSLSPAGGSAADDPEFRARRRMIGFLRFVRSQDFFVAAHRMEAHESPDPAFAAKCGAMKIMLADAPHRWLLEISHDVTSARISMGVAGLLVLVVFWLDFFADESGGVLVSSAAFHLAMLLLVAAAAIRAGILFLRRERLLFTEDVLHICRHGLFGWRVSHLSRRGIREVIAEGKGRRSGVRHLLAETDDGERVLVTTADDDASADWLRWVTLFWLGRVYDEEEEEDAAPAVADAVPGATGQPPASDAAVADVSVAAAVPQAVPEGVPAAASVPSAAAAPAPSAPPAADIPRPSAAG